MRGPDNLIRLCARWSSHKTQLQGAYFTTFGIFGMTFYIIPYFIWSHDSDIEYQTLAVRILACVLCFYLIIFHQTTLWRATQTVKKRYNKEAGLEEILVPQELKKLIYKEVYKSFLPLYWHITLCYCLPLMASYNLLESSFDTTWVVSSALSVFVLVLLVDWISFIVLTVIGVIAGYVIYAIWTGDLAIYSGSNYFLVMYLYFVSMFIGGFFLYQKEMMMKEVTQANKELEKLNNTLDKKVQKRTEYLKKALKSKTDFLNNISHEVRTPLQGILGISSTLVEHWKNISEQERYNYIRVIADSGDRLINLVSNLLDLSKFDAGKMLFDFKKLPLIDALNDAIAQLTPLYIDKNVKINFLNLIDPKTFLYYDSDRIAQVVRNFISNAIKYSNYRDVNITLEYADEYGNPENKKKAKTALIKVTDQGVGVPEEEIKAIFLPFAQSSRTQSKAGGTGLGLALCAEIVHAHGGKIWAYNNPDSSGATFCFTIPLNDAQGPTHTSSQDNKVVNSYSSESKKYNILFVDDENFCQMAGKVILECAGFNVVTAENGAEALEKVAKEDFDLILLDLMMPDMTGNEVLVELKKDKRYANIPVVLQSGASDHAEIAKAKSLGAEGYIVKPYNKTVILTQVNKILGLTPTE